jgi:hypothetical protein
MKGESLRELEERHISRFEVLVTKQRMLVECLERDGHLQQADLARDILEPMEMLLKTAWQLRDATVFHR